MAILSNFDSMRTIGVMLLPSAGVALLTGWATWLSGVFQQYAPLSWVVAALAGGLVAMFLVMMATLVRMWWWRVTLARGLHQAGNTVNPVDTVFRNQRIRLADMMPPIGNRLSGKTFHDCELVGPIVLVPYHGSTIKDCTWASCDHVLMRLIKLNDGRFATDIRNGYFLQDCTFLRCTFFNVTFLMPEHLFEEMRGNNVHWITHTPDDPPKWSKSEETKK